MTLSPAASLLIESARRRDVSRWNPALEDLPRKFKEFYPRQVDAIKEAVQAYEDGHKLVVLEGPPGTGKTLIGEAIRRLRREKTVYICSTKSLQEQFVRDFPYGKVIKGRGNYPTQLYPERFRLDGLSCADCTKGSGNTCQWCSSPGVCPYETVKRDCVKADLIVANTAYFLSECNSLSKMSIRGRGFVIADEADTLDDQLLKYVTVGISKTRVRKYGLRVPKQTVEDDWREWVKEAIPVIKREFAVLPGYSDNVDIIRERNYLSTLLAKLDILDAGLEDDKWVFSGDKESVEFKPVWVDQVAKKSLWDHGKSWLLMSATIGNADELVRGLGWEDDYKFIGMPSVFKAENRRVIGRPVANLSFKTQAEERPKLVQGIQRIAANHPNTRILVHTVSYDLTAYLLKELECGRTKLSYRNASERDSVLRRFVQSPSAILLAPSFDRGIDLPGDACRVQVIAKVPYPNTGDKQINKRLYGSGKAGKQWYTMQTIRTIVQMCGRAVRSQEDWAVTYILDQQFVKLYAEFGHWFPGGRGGWWGEALRWEY